MSVKPASDSQDGEEAYSKATRAELQKNWDSAFRLYVRAVECYLHASRKATDDAIRVEYKARAAKSLERAEKIKQLKRNVAPVPVDRFSQQYQYYVLDKSSVINGLRFELWDRSTSKGSEGQPGFSPEQVACSAEYQRPQDLSPHCQVATASLMPHDITQHLVSDCSVSSSLAVCVEHARRFGTKLGLSSLYPQDTQGVPCAPADGKHAARFLFNGAYRRATFDDKLPYSSDGIPLCMSAISKGQLWPSLLGKGYMKLMGGYDFPGSNSSIDLHAITGWIPEHLEFHSPTFERENTWSRLVAGFNEGRCIATVGTDKKSNIVWNGRTLLPAHCYAVIDIHEVGGERVLTLLDPLIPCESWESGEGQTCTNGIDSQSRAWQISWDDACHVLHSIYLSWDPSLFPNQLTFHGIWKPESSENELKTAYDHLRLQVSSPVDCELWVVLTRHVVDRRRISEYIALRVEQDDSLSDQASLQKLASQGMYTNSPHTSARIRLQGPEDIISILISYEGLFEETAYTVTAYSTVPLSWDRSTPPPTYVKKMEGILTMKNAGGSCVHPTFMLNPQYHLRIQSDTNTRDSKSKGGRKATVEFLLQGDRSLPLNLTVLWSEGQRVTELSPNDIAVGSGPYSYGLAHARKDLPPGEYTLVVSAFEPDQQGKFSLQVASNRPFELEPIPQEGAGMYTKTVRGTWDHETAAGAAPFNRYFSNPQYELHVKSQTQVKIRLQLAQPSPLPALNVSLFRETSESSPARVLTSGPYADAVCGVLTPQITLAPGTYLLVPSTYEPGCRVPFRVIVYSTAAGVTLGRRK